MYSDADAVVRIAKVVSVHNVIEITSLKCLMLRAAALVSAALAGVIRATHCGKKVVAISGKFRHKNLREKQQY